MRGVHLGPQIIFLKSVECFACVPDKALNMSKFLLRRVRDNESFVFNRPWGRQLCLDSIVPHDDIIKTYCPIPHTAFSKGSLSCRIASNVPRFLTDITKIIVAGWDYDGDPASEILAVFEASHEVGISEFNCSVCDHPKAPLNCHLRERQQLSGLLTGRFPDESSQQMVGISFSSQEDITKFASQKHNRSLQNAGANGPRNQHYWGMLTMHLGNSKQQVRVSCVRVLASTIYCGFGV